MSCRQLGTQLTLWPVYWKSTCALLTTFRSETLPYFWKTKVNAPQININLKTNYVCLFFVLFSMSSFCLLLSPILFAYLAFYFQTPPPKKLKPFLTVTPAKVTASLVIHMIFMLWLNPFSWCNEGRQGAKLDYFDDDNLFNQVIGWLSGMAAWPLPSTLSRKCWSLPVLLCFHCRGFQIHHNKWNSGSEETVFYWQTMQLQNS